MERNEVLDGLNSSGKTEYEALKDLQVQAEEAIKELTAAREAGDEGLVSEASAKVDKIGVDIRSTQEKIEAIQTQKGWFKEYQFDEAGDEVKSLDAEKQKKMEEFFESLKSNVSASGAKRTAGEEFANILKYRGITRWSDVKDINAFTRLVVPIGKNASLMEEFKTLTATKSLYTNHGEELLDVNSDPVPGFMGFQCGIVEDPTVTCLLEPPADDFEECITQATLNGNRIRFTREVSRDSNPASVLETVYNPYPDFERDGTKPEGVFTLANVTVNDSKIAEFVTASDEVLEDCPSVASLIDNFLISGINQEKRRQLIAGSGSAGQMRGILNQPDVLTRTHQDVGDGGALDDNIYDTFRRGLTDLYYQAASTDNVCVIMNPRDLEIIDLQKDDMGRYLFNDSDCFNRQLRCLKIRTSVDMPAGTAVLGEFANNWVFYTRKALEIRMGLTGDQFITNTQTILGEMRGLTLVRCPRKILKITGLA